MKFIAILLISMVLQSNCNDIWKKTDPWPKDSYKICQGKKADIVFVLDSSSSIEKHDFQRQLLFLQHVIALFDIDSGKTQIGAVSFSNWAFLDFHLNEFSRKSDISDRISQITQAGGDTNIAGALEFVRTQMFLPKNGFRFGIPHIVILLTDGKSNSAKETALASLKAKRVGIHLIAIGVGSEVDERDLYAIATADVNNRYVYRVDNYASLESVKDLLAIGACTVPKPIYKTPEQIIEEVNFDDLCDYNNNDIVLSASPSSTVHGRHKSLNLFDDFISNFDLNDNMRFGVVPEDCWPYPKIEFEKQISKDLLLEQIDEIFDYNVPLSDRLKLIKDTFNNFQGSRRNVRKNGVVILEPDDVQDLTKVDQEAKAMGDAGIELFVIAVGKEFGNITLEGISEHIINDRSIMVDSYHDLVNLKDELRKAVCLTPKNSS